MNCIAFKYNASISQGRKFKPRRMAKDKKGKKKKELFLSHERVIRLQS